MQYFPSGRTVLVIAHRLSTIRSANLIYVIMARKLERNPANPILKFNYTDKDVKGIQVFEGFTPSHKVKLPMISGIKIDLMKRLFNTSDLHGDNVGVDSKGTLFIIDFRVSGYSIQSKNRNVWQSYRQSSG
ncbi:hypothetical protein L5515_002139 [Caenorhabditis briggsae]|uniref:Uncharacterized protein n=1 Tax=Caenorhabditis briggsae TaxID=6238 RepID=A0AAE9E5Q0_CAEBR|nr:hypothetical protein L5515_002139 [Caenorhabditis briggsae]